MAESYDDIAKMIDHALLTPTTTLEQLEIGCRFARAYDVASVCVLPFHLKRAAELLAGSSVLPSTVIGFPLGGQVTGVKRYEAETALADGGRELDMVVNVSQVLSGQWRAVEGDIAAVLEAVRAAGQKLKVIFENCYLQREQKLRLCQICGELDVDWVKTSTGFGSGGATLDDVRLMREHSPTNVQVKASGGVRDLGSVLQYRALGATRIGTSRTAEILDTWRDRLGLPAIHNRSAEQSGTAGY